MTKAAKYLMKKALDPADLAKIPSAIPEVAGSAWEGLKGLFKRPQTGPTPSQQSRSADVAKYMRGGGPKIKIPVKK